MGNVNKVFLMGNLTRDPELRYTPSGTAVCEFGLAVNRRYKTQDGEQHDDTCFVTVNMWGRRGTVVSEYFKKGSQIFVEGRLNYDSWETPDGKRSKLTVVAENFEFVGPRQGPAAEDAGAAGEGRAGPRRREAPPPPSSKTEQQESDEGHDVPDDEIPF